MAFQNLRNSNQLFILHKDSVPTLEIGKVTNVSVPVPKYGNPGMYNQEMIVDIMADINGTSANFQKLPAMGEHKSIIVINRPDSAEEFIDTYNHEKNHVEMHICKEFGIDPYSEKAAYLSGQLAKKLFKAQLKNWIK